VKPAVYFAAALGLAVFCAPAAPKPAVAYDGLMSGSSTSEGYDGLLAPTQPGGRKSSRGADEPPGYDGLVPGSVPQRPVEPEADNDTAPKRPSTAATPPAGQSPAVRPAATTRAPAQTARPELPMTPRPGRLKTGPISSAEQLLMLASLNGKRLDLSKIADNVKPSPGMFGLKNPTLPRINGMASMEFLAKNQIDKIMGALNNPALSAEQRQKVAQQGYQQLLVFADGVMTRRTVPDEVFLKMGMPESLLAEEKDANERALARYEEAFKILRPMQ